MSKENYEQLESLMEEFLKTVKERGVLFNEKIYDLESRNISLQAISYNEEVGISFGHTSEDHGLLFIWPGDLSEEIHYEILSKFAKVFFTNDCLINHFNIKKEMIDQYDSILK